MVTHIALETGPGAYVVPAEAAGEDDDIVRPLQHAVVDRDRGTAAVGIGGILCLAGLTIGLYLGEVDCHVGEVLLQRIDDVDRLPDEDPRIPEVIASGEQSLSLLQIGLFLKSRHTIDPLLVGLTGELDVAVAGRGIGRLDADRHEDVVLRHVGDRLMKHPLVGDCVIDVVVRRTDHHDRLGILGVDPVGGIGDAGGGIAPHRLRQHLRGMEVGQLPQHLVLVELSGHHVEVACRCDSL